MSMDKKEPKIRFKGFSGEWKGYSLATFISSLDGGVSVNSGDRAANENEFGILKTSCVTNGFFEPHENKVVFKTEEINRLKEPVLENTIIISRMNTPALVGASAYISRGYANYFLPDRLWAAKPTAIGDLKFIAYILGSDKGRLALSDLATGTSGSMKNISKPAVLRLEVVAPEKKEQIQIGNFFKNLDSLIHQHQQKHEKLSTLKKAMLEKMFPKQGETIPEIRFKGFSGEWEEKDFSDIASRASTYHKSTYLPCVEYEDIVSGTGKFNKDIHQKRIFKTGLKFEVDDVLFGKLRPYLKNWFLADFEGIAVGDFWVLRAENVSSTFLFSLIQTSKFELVSNLSAGSKMPRSDWKLVSSSCFFVPKNISESYKIGNYFQKLDALIHQHQQQITKLNNIKQACLSKMFV